MMRKYPRSHIWRSGVLPGVYTFALLPVSTFETTPKNSFSIFDIVTFILIFISIGIIAILIDRQLRASKRQSFESIHLLEKERNALEQRVSERTLELITARKTRIEEIERIARFGELSRGLFHDLMNPLSAASLSIEQLAAHATSAEETESIIKKAVEASKRMGAYMDSIKAVMITTSDTEKSSDTKACLSITLDLLAYKARTANVRVERHDPHSYLLAIHPLRLQQIFLNLISNAIEACEQTKGNQEKIVSIYISASKKLLIITISDNGSGVSVEHIDDLFKKSFTTKNGGTGIGLMTVRSIIEDELGGTIHITNAPTGGAVCEVKIPLEASPSR